jgi:hypothetical protein
MLRELLTLVNLEWQKYSSRLFAIVAINSPEQHCVAGNPGFSNRDVVKSATEEKFADAGQVHALTGYLKGGNGDSFRDPVSEATGFVTVRVEPSIAK